MNNDFYSNDLHCVAPFSSLVLLLSDEVQPCCNWIADPALPINTRVDSNTTINRLFENANSKVRKIFLKKEHQNYNVCNKCFEGGQDQYVSHNQAAKIDNHNFIADPLLTNLHIQPSNFCNLACRMCSPWNSNLLAKEKGIEKINDHRFNSDKKFEIKRLSEGTPLFESVLAQLQYINTLWFSGGEPLINREVWIILKYAVEKGYCENISLKFNTNGTLSLTEEKIKVLRSFKNLQLDISIDGVGEVAEYIRTNLKFEEWVKNFKIFKDKFKNQVDLVYTASVFNIHLYDDALDYFNDYQQAMTVNFCYWPESLSAVNLSVEAKNYIIEKYSKSKHKDNKIIQLIIEFLQLHMYKKNNNISISEFIEKQDKNAIKQNLYKKYRPYKEIQPEWFEYLKK